MLAKRQFAIPVAATRGTTAADLKLHPYSLELLPERRKKPTSASLLLCQASKQAKQP